MKKTLAIATTAAALAAIAVPVMAFENEVHGTSRLRMFFSNYENGGGGNPLTTQADPTKANYGLIAPPAGNYTNTAPGTLTPTLGSASTYPASDKLKTNNYFEQRSRLFYTAKASDDLKLVTGFEIDSVFGDRSQGGTVYGSTAGAAPTAGSLANAAGATGRNIGGGLESDTVNLETKWVYLDFKIPSTTTRVSAGIQPVKDQIKGIFFDADVAGIMTKSDFGPVGVQTGYFRGYDKTYFTYSNKNQPRGVDTLTIGALQTQFSLNKDTKLGGAYYIYDDARGQIPGFGSDLQAHVLALTADAKVGPLTLSGFGAYQGGIIKDVTPGRNAYLNAYAFNAAVKVAVGPGTLKTAMLYTSGNGDQDAANGHLKGWIGTSQSSNNAWSSTAGTSTYNESGMLLLNRNAAAGTGTTDVNIAYNTGNGTNPLTMQGMYLYSLGFDANITPKVYVNTNLGLLWAAHTNVLKPVDYAVSKMPGATVSGSRNASNFMGSELNVETGYKMYDNLTLSLQAAYVMLGGYYNNSSLYSTTTKTPKDPQNPYTVRTSLIFNF
jgi:hypothetical protein